MSAPLPPHDNNEEKEAERIQPLSEDQEKAVDTTAPSSQPSTSSAPAQEHPDDEGPASPASILTPQNPQQYAQASSDIPPPLPYSCWDHKLSIGIFWFFILAETCFVPISLYYGLWFGTTVDHGALFAIITSVFGFVSGYEYGCRAYLLLLPRDTYRPLFSPRRFWGFDFTQYLLLPPYTVLTGILIGGSIPKEPLTRILAMPMAVGNLIFGLFFVISGVAHALQWKLPFRMSSHLKGAPAPPVTFTIIEDVVAVDAGQGKTYREALLQRYNASPRFRRLLVEVLWFWGVPSVVVGVVVLALIFTVTKEVSYGLGWSIPNIWAGLWTVITVLWVRRGLRIEKEMWVKDREALS